MNVSMIDYKQMSIFEFDAESLSMAVPVGQCVLEDALLRLTQEHL